MKRHQPSSVSGELKARRGEGGVRSPKPRSCISCGEGGYVLLGVVIVLVIMGIFMGAAAPVWQHIMKREREEELIWRGKQYVQAIKLYQNKHPGAYPPKLDILVEQKFLRKLFPDPMTEDGEWKLLRQNSPEIRTLSRPGGRRGGQGAAGQQPGSEQPGLRQRQQEQRSVNLTFVSLEERFRRSGR